MFLHFVTTIYDEIFYFFVKNKFTGGLQPSLMFNYTFISIKLIHYFSRVIRNAPCHATFTKIKFPFALLQNAELSSTTFANYLQALPHNQFRV